jgi:hypothetical protein
MEDSRHFQEMLQERGIPLAWADRAVADADKTEEHEDGTIHYLKQIEEHGSRWLRVVVRADVDPARRITAFFDRRLRD